MRSLFGVAGKRSLLGRMFALLAMVLFLAVGAEQMIPDVHDGDARAATTSAPTAMHQLPACDVAFDSHAEQPASNGGAPHTAHVDHCAHSHVVMPSDGQMSVARAAWRSHSAAQSPNEPQSAELEPRFRPPIA